MAKTQYIWDPVNDTYLMEKDAVGNTMAVYTNQPGEYGPLISQRREGQTNYYHFDGQQSTRALTDENQNATDTYTYTAFGETVAKAGTTTNPFGYRGALGYYVDGQTSGLYVRQEIYVPSIAIWLSRAPASPLSSSPYCYLANSPTGILDPSSHIAMGAQPTWPPGDKPGTIEIALSACNADQKKKNGGGCCCVSVTAKYVPSRKDKERYKEIQMFQAASTTADDGCFGKSGNPKWHWDEAKEEMYVWPTNSPSKAMWTDAPGGGPEVGDCQSCQRHWYSCSCLPWQQQWYSLKQKFEVCAVGSTGASYQIIGCRQYTNTCTITNKPDPGCIRCCFDCKVTSCINKWTGGGQDMTPMPSQHLHLDFRAGTLDLANSNVKP